MLDTTLYCRFSDRPLKDGEAESIARQEDAASIQTQLEANRRYCTFHNLKVTSILKDTFISARLVPLFERPEGSKLKDLPPGHNVVCAKLARMFRNVDDGRDTLAHFQKRGVILHFSDEGGVSINTGTAKGKLVATMLLAVAEYEPEETAERTSQGMCRRQRDGQRMSRQGYEPYGKMTDPYDPSRLIDNPEEIAVIGIVKAMHAAGNSLNAICRAMDGVPLRGKRWHPMKVSKMLQS